MANLKETAQWEEGIYQIETSDPVMGGENGIDNKPLLQLANRTAYLKQELANTTAVTTQAINNKANQSHAHPLSDITGLQVALNGKLGVRGLLNETDLDTLSGSQNVGIWAQNIANRATSERHYPIADKAGTLLVLPSAHAGQQVYLPMGESVLYRRHTSDNSGTWGAWQSIGGQAASLTRAGLVQLSSATDSDDEDKAATPRAVKTAYDRATEAEKKGLPIGAVVAFPKAIANPTGYLKADGTTFDAATYPDLYKALGNKNKLPDLTRSDVGVTAYFPTDRIPAGWLAFDEIGSQVTASTYPELHAQLIQQYGSLDRVPQAQDRFIRNASGNLTVGQVQEDEIKAHNHRLPLISSPSYHPSINQYFNDFVLKPEQWTLINDGNMTDNGWGRPLSQHALTGGEETRPKSLVLKLCIKAKNTFDEAAFWIKAYGQIQSSGSLDADALAADIQALRSRLENEERERQNDDRNLMARLDSLNQHLLPQRQHIGGWDIVRFADGTMIQTTLHTVDNPTTIGNRTLTYPVAFIAAPHMQLSIVSDSPTAGDVFVVQSPASTATALTYWMAEAGQRNVAAMQLSITALGRWK